MRAWIGWPGTAFQPQERTFDQTIEAAGKAGFEVSYNFDQTMYMRGSKRGGDTLRKLSDEVWKLAQARFGVVDERWGREIEISCARVTKYE